MGQIWELSGRKMELTGKGWGEGDYKPRNNSFQPAQAWSRLTRQELGLPGSGFLQGVGGASQQHVTPWCACLCGTPGVRLFLVANLTTTGTK